MRALSALAEQVAATIERHRMVLPGQRLGIAVSGGADSVCLLHILVDLAPRWNLVLTVLHLDHCLRGEESAQDAQFVRHLAGSLGLPVEIRAANVADTGDNLEQAARRARMAFFLEMIGHGCVDRVATAHTRSDQAETVLYRFLRGSGSAGLSGIRPVTAEGIVRPLLDVERPDVEAYLRDRGIPWREDSSNRSRRFLRNRIRLDLMPQLIREWNPNLVKTLAHTAEWAQAEEFSWESELQSLSATCLQVKSGSVLVRADTLWGLPLAAGRRLVRQAMEQVKGDLRGIDFRHVRAVLELAAPGRGSGQVLAPGLAVVRSLDWLRFCTPAPHPSRFRHAVAAPCAVDIPGGSTVSLELIEKSETSPVQPYVYNGEVAFLDWLRLSGSLELRNWQAGDQYQPVSAARVQKIKILFQEARVPSWDRPLWPVLTDGQAIVWARQFGPARGVAADGGSRVVLKIRELPGNLESGSGKPASKVLGPLRRFREFEH